MKTFGKKQSSRKTTKTRTIKNKGKKGGNGSMTLDDGILLDDGKPGIPIVFGAVVGFCALLMLGKLN
mgnify:FL=1|jgi:hypothetical protein